MSSISISSINIDFDPSYQQLYGNADDEKAIVDNRQENIPIDQGEMYKCPVFKTYFRHPVRLNCPSKHAFEKFAVVFKDTISCPVCGHEVTKLDEDKKLEKLVQKYILGLSSEERKKDEKRYNRKSSDIICKSFH